MNSFVLIALVCLGLAIVACIGSVLYSIYGERKKKEVDEGGS